MASKELSNKEKNDSRVTLLDSNVTGYYWGRKYAFREYGQGLSADVFHDYLKQIGHPVEKCMTQDKTSPKFLSAIESIAYKEDRLEAAISELISSAEKKTKTLYESSLFDRRFKIHHRDANKP